MKQGKFFNDIGFLGRPRFGQAFGASIWYLTLLLLGLITDICLVHADFRESTLWTFAIS